MAISIRADAAWRPFSSAGHAHSGVSFHIPPADLDRVLELPSSRSKGVTDGNVRVCMRRIESRIAPDDDHVFGERDLETHVKQLSRPVLAMRLLDDNRAPDDAWLHESEAIAPAFDRGFESIAGLHVAKRDVDR
jgi:hypothetical protein